MLTRLILSTMVKHILNFKCVGSNVSKSLLSSVADFRCKDRRSCVSRSLVCDGRSHCQDGSDELDCPSISAAPSRSAAPPQSDVLKCRVGSRPCRDGRQCVLYSHECDGETDCEDGSDEQDCGELF